MSHEPTEQSFLKDVASHEMTIIREDGVYRHVQFKRPGTYCYQFDLITWPGYLCYCGDMGTYVFQRLEDMFEFFRTDREHIRLRDGKTLAINLGYWSEKLQAVDGNRNKASATEFDEEKFNRVIIEHLVSWIRDHRDETTKDERRELWDSVMDEVIGADGDGGGYRKQTAAYDFRHRINARIRDFEFTDFFEYNVESYTYQFIWCCYALAWGIQKYDAGKDSHGH